MNFIYLYEKSGSERRLKCFVESTHTHKKKKKNHEVKIIWKKWEKIRVY